MATNSLLRPAMAEALGTMALVFVGAGSAVSFHQANLASAGGVAGLVGVALAHGLVLAAMIITLGHVSGGHFNPAVTIAALFTRRLNLPLAVFYVCAQVLGAVAAALLLDAVLPASWWDVPGLHMGTPSLAYGVSPQKGLAAEAVLTFFLVLVVIGSAMEGRNTSRVLAGLAIGFTVSAGILVGGPLTGAALNPARAFGPALISHQFAYHYVYWAGPLLGGLVAGLVYDAAFAERRAPASKVEPAGPASEPSSGAPTEGAEPQPATT